MTNSSITDIFLKVAEEKLERRVASLVAKSIHEQNGPKLEDGSTNVGGMLSSHSTSLKDAYFNNVQVLNDAGKALAEHGFDFEPIDVETAYHAAYNRIVEKYNPKS